MGKEAFILYHNFEWYKYIYVYETLIGKDMYDSTINSPKGFATNKSGNIKNIDDE